MPQTKIIKNLDDPLKKPKRIVDVGRGICGSSRYLANKYGAQVQGITLSPVQAKRTHDIAMSEALADKVADAIDQPFPDGQFDLVWSMESGEHMPDKENFVRELARVAAPGGTIIIVTWCHRDLSPSEEELKPDEINLLNKLCSSFYLPKWCSAVDYVYIAKSLSLEDVKTADWFENVAPFWPYVVRSTLTWHGFISLMRSDDPLKKPKRIIDVGCRIGGSSRYLANKYGAQVQGITLSPVQAKRAQDLAMSEALANKVPFQVADAIDQTFLDGQFDLVWSMESGKHMPDKEKFVRKLARVATRGGTIIIVTWCHRDLSPFEEELKPDEINLLNKLWSSFYMPKWCSTADYVDIAKSLSLEDVKTADWSVNVAPFWHAVVRSALTWHIFISLMRSGWRTVRGALAMPLMIAGYSKGLIKFAIITCRKPK